MRETLQQDKELTIHNTSIGIIGPVGTHEKSSLDGSFRIIEGETLDIYLKSMVPKDTGATVVTQTSEPAAAPPPSGNTRDEDVQMGE